MRGFLGKWKTNLTEWFLGRLNRHRGLCLQCQTSVLLVHSIQMFRSDETSLACIGCFREEAAPERKSNWGVALRYRKTQGSALRQAWTVALVKDEGGCFPLDCRVSLKHCVINRLLLLLLSYLAFVFVIWLSFFFFLLAPWASGPLV